MHLWLQKGWSYRTSFDSYRFVLRWRLTDEERPRVLSAMMTDSVLCEGRENGWNRGIIEEMFRAIGSARFGAFAHRAREEDILSEVRRAVRSGDLLAYKEEKAEPPQMWTPWPNKPLERPPEPPRKEYHLVVSTVCKATGKPLAGAPFVVRDGRGRDWDKGKTDQDGRATSLVKVRGNFDVLVFPNAVKTSLLHLVDDVGRPLSVVDATLKDSGGSRHVLKSDERGVAVIPASMGGASSLEIKGCEVFLYLDPRFDSYTVRVPGLLAPRNSSGEFDDYGQSGVGT